MNTSSVEMSKIAQILIILVAVVAVGVADIFLKRATAQGGLVDALRSPWFFIAIGLYLLQIIIFIVAFVAGWKLSIIGALQTALYGLVVLGAGYFLFHESPTRLQIVGMVMAFGGVVMINWQ